MAGGQLLVSPARGGGQKFMSPGGQFVMSLDRKEQEENISSARE
ncbi:hypothetical protein DB41_GR00020 [Neochlamydia sp. TUME1]|nr:hypothetical protein [Neochlamydia sp. TUME1]KIC75990.1 hypothetical protein DB41_GR00020 [Neochlamydia sp. TUME1]